MIKQSNSKEYNAEESFKGLVSESRAKYVEYQAWRFNETALRKLSKLLEDGYVINGFSFQKQDEHDVKRGFITKDGLVGWWSP
jgi:hypothetical protein